MEQTTFADVLQKSFVAMSMGGTERITTLNILVNVLMSFLIGMFIFYIYKKTFQGVLYQRSFNVSLVLASTVTSLIIMTISGNLILSLGMVGALSIVRFRTPIKDSMDLIFLFWAITVGIANGVGYYNISIVGSILIAIFLLGMSKKQGDSDGAFLLVLSFTDKNREDEITSILSSETKSYSVKSRLIQNSVVELTVELKTKDSNTSFLNDLDSIESVEKVALVAYEQDLASA